MNKKGFTLIEVLVVVLIIGVLSAVALPGYRKAMEKAKAAGAIQALSDISKAEHDYFYAQSRYTDDFGKLAITIFPDATGDTHETQFFTYTLEDDAVTANRDIGEDSYTLYRQYTNPVTYCSPEGNKYCKVFGLPVIDLNTNTGTNNNQSVGNWQSCDNGYPCTKACTRNITMGYNCNGTYNEDGSYSEKVCDDKGSCLTTSYDADNHTIKTNFCYTYEDGICTYGFANTYDSNGNQTSTQNCSAWDESGNCTESHGDIYFYDQNNNQIGYRYCEQFNGNGTCATYGDWGWYNAYDDQNRIIRSMECDGYDEHNNCTTGYFGYDSSYDENGNITVKTCSYYSDGNCQYYEAVRKYFYDEHGNTIERECATFNNSDGTCETLSNDGYVEIRDGNTYKTMDCNSWTDETTCSNYSFGGMYNYDANGNEISYTECASFTSGGDCVVPPSDDEYYYLGYVNAYDDANNRTFNASCKHRVEGGACDELGSGYVYSYQDGHITAQAGCTTWNAPGDCETYADYGDVYNYVDGKLESHRECTEWTDSSTCNTYGDYGEAYEVDANGKITRSAPCTSWSSNNTCAEADWSQASRYVYDEHGNSIANFEYMPDDPDDPDDWSDGDDWDDDGWTGDYDGWDDPDA